MALPFVDGDGHAHVEDALRAGASLALVAEGWAGLGALPAALRARCAVVKEVLPAFRELAAALRRRMACPVVAVAGSNGKTTTKEMLAALLSGPGARVVRTPGTDNGFVGLPRTLCRACSRGAAPEAVVLEIGIDAKGAMADHARMVAPDIVVITALGPEHLDGLGDVETAVAEELKLVEEAPSARRVLPWSDPEIQERTALLREGDVAVVEEGALARGDVAWPEVGSVLLFRAALSGEGSRVTLAWSPDGDRSSPAWEGALNVPMPGLHNAEDAALAMAAALLLGRSGEEATAGWAAFEPPPWRSSVKALCRGALLVDDCFNASPRSVEAALAALTCPAWAGRPKVAVLGDMLDLGAEPQRWHDALMEPLLAVEGLRLFLFGPRMSALGERLREAGHGALVVGRLAGQGDPVDLVAGMDLLPGSVVLVKGSRGMKMERVARYLEMKWSLDPDGMEREVALSIHSVFVAGSHGTLAATRTIDRALQCFGPGAGRLDREGAFIDGARVAAPRGAPGARELWRRCVAAGGSHAVVEVLHEDALAAAAMVAFDIGVFTGLSGADMPPGGDVERHLAEKAQLFAGRRGLKVAVLNGDDPASELIAEVLPPGVRALRYGTEGAALGPVDLLASRLDVTELRARAALIGPPEMPGAIEVRGGDVESLRGVMAALLIVLALGASPRRAAAHLC